MTVLQPAVVDQLGAVRRLGVRSNRLAAVCALAASLLAVPPAAVAQQPVDATPQTTSVVVATGEAVVRTVPDRAWITITAESRAPSPVDAQRRNADAMRPVQDKLRAAQVPAEAIRTVGYDLQQEWDYVDNRRISRGYVARNSIEVRVDDIERVGELLEIAVGTGATGVSNLRFDLKDRSRFEREALRQAVADARGKAEAAAAGAGSTIARILRIEEHGAVMMPPPQPMMRELAQAARSDAPPISAGEMEIRAQVTLTASLQ